MNKEHIVQDNEEVSEEAMLNFIKFYNEYCIRVGKECFNGTDTIKSKEEPIHS